MISASFLNQKEIELLGKMYSANPQEGIRFVEKRGIQRGFSQVTIDEVVTALKESKEIKVTNEVTPLIIIPPEKDLFIYYLIKMLSDHTFELPVAYAIHKDEVRAVVYREKATQVLAHVYEYYEKISRFKQNHKKGRVPEKMKIFPSNVAKKIIRHADYLKSCGITVDRFVDTHTRTAIYSFEYLHKNIKNPEAEWEA